VLETANGARASTCLERSEACGRKAISRTLDVPAAGGHNLLFIDPDFSDTRFP